MRVKGYMVEVSYEDGVLTAHASNKMARAAMAGEMAAAPDTDDAAVVREQVGDEVHRALNDDLVLRRDQIAEVEVKDASMLANGRLTITTTDGRHHILHFRRKQRHDFRELADALQT
jgi:hypothetical protein